MPKGVYRKKTKRGWMHFRDGKLISKSSYLRSKGAKRSTRKGGIRKTARRAYVRKNNKRSNGKMKKAIPHPSVTGMASGLAIAAYLNAGQTTRGATGKILARGEGVIKDVTDGQLGEAFSTLSTNAINMIASDDGRKTLVTAGGIALLGAFARRQFPQLKLGGSKLYFRL
jgi:hypothetical protein